jgi:hypothetical protein
VLSLDVSEGRVLEKEGNPVMCLACDGIFCVDCDIFIHTTLLQCPTCD